MFGAWVLAALCKCEENLSSCTCDTFTQALLPPYPNKSSIWEDGGSIVPGLFPGCCRMLDSLNRCKVGGEGVAPESQDSCQVGLFPFLAPRSTKHFFPQSIDSSTLSLRLSRHLFLPTPEEDIHGVPLATCWYHSTERPSGAFPDLRSLSLSTYSSLVGCFL